MVPVGKAVQEFLEQGERSGLFSTAVAADLIAQLTPVAGLSADDIAARMVERKILTSFQAEQLLVGRGEECLIAGRYRVLEKLGEGGMGTVYKASDMKLDRLVAVKVLPPGRLHDADAVARLQREAKALARLSHPHIVQAYDCGEDRQRHFVVMEYVEGVTLDHLLRQHGALPPTIAADFIHQAALGLEHAHAKGLIHRDLKPGNLLLAGYCQLGPRVQGTAATVDYHSSSSSRWTQGPAVVKILDLGLARFLQDQLGDARLTQEGTGVGTPDYMAPEQFRDALHADARTDIYGLGCTLYHLIAGQVPFPGSSFSEKAQAHAQKELLPLEQRCPEVPGGLAFVVTKMMAKHPDQRFQTAAEAADALAPYVAGGSHSMIRLRQTGKWPGGRATTPRPTRFKRVLLGSAGLGSAALAIAAVLLALVLSIWPGRFGTETSPSAGPAVPAPTQDVSQTKQPEASPPPGPAAQGNVPQRKPDESSQPPGDPNILTVSQDPKDGGRFRSIGEAVANVEPWQTIRVLDDAEYAETLSLAQPDRHAGVTLEAPRRATLAPASKTRIGVAILSIPEVTVRGFRIRGDIEGPVIVAGRSPGVRLDSLDIQTTNATMGGIGLEGLAIAKEEPPLIVQDCRIQPGGGRGIRISGIAGYNVPLTCKRVIIRGNRFSNCAQGILAIGSLQEIYIVGNVITDATMVGLQLENLLAGTEQILVANNTFLGSQHAIRVWDDDAKGKDVQVRNNLILGAVLPDLLFIDSGGDQMNPRGPGDTVALRKRWELGHNWREVKEPTGEGVLEQSWIPPGPGERRQERIDVLSRDPKHPDYLRPAKDSPVALEGAGNTDPRLPTYAGAVPPEGVSSWDWDRTWRMPKDAQLLTVSQEEKDGGQFRTINDALVAARPWATVKVVDDATYVESLIIADRAQHAGITLAAPQGATLALEGNAKRALLISGVPDVRVQGFRFFSDAEGMQTTFLIIASGPCAGTVLERLKLEMAQGGLGIVAQNVTVGLGEEPLIVQNCTIQGGYNGIVASGQEVAAGQQGNAASGVVLRENHVVGARGTGILLRGSLERVQVAGNVIWNCGLAALEIIDLAPATREVVLANNSLFDSAFTFRIFDFPPFQELVRGQVELRNNLLFDALSGDMAFLVLQGNAGLVDAEQNTQTVELWDFGHNWRDLSGDQPVMPLAPADKKLDGTAFSRDPNHPDFLRPRADSPLATGGAGQDDLTLPSYVGAVSPQGVEPWNWDKTWRWRTKKAARAPAESAGAAGPTGGGSR